MTQKTASRKALAEAVWRDNPPWYGAMLRRVEYWRNLYELSEQAQEQIGPVIEVVDAAIAAAANPPTQMIELQKALKDTRRELKRFLKTKGKGAAA
jgi:hypothetical protein